MTSHPLLPVAPQVLEEAHNAQKLRQMAPPARLKEQGYDQSKRELLTVEDLQKALEEVSRSGSSSVGGWEEGGACAAAGAVVRWCGGALAWL